jgi:signal peptidase II
MYMMKTKKQLTTLSLAAGILILAGGIGNMSNILLHERHVTDFVNIGVDGLRSGIFNFADVYITAGAILFFISSFANRNMLNDENTRKHG